MCKSSYFLYNSKTWTLLLKSSFSSVHIILFLGGISEHFIWHVDLVWTLHLKTWPNSAICTHHLILGVYIWALHLTSWPTWTLHLKTWPNSTICTHHLILLGVHPIWTLHPKFEHPCHFVLCFTEGLFILHTKDLIMGCNSVAWIYGQLVGGQSVIDPCYTITPPHQSTIDPCNTITPHRSHT